MKMTNQLDEYTSIGVATKDERVKNPLQWWLEYGSNWPILQQMALDIFSIPAMSAECERVFSQCGRLITKDRNRLGDDTVEADECQKIWLQKGVV
jgi:hypothetical protein